MSVHTCHRRNKAVQLGERASNTGFAAGKVILAAAGITFKLWLSFPND
jgi:hypothetical protein